MKYIESVLDRFNMKDCKTAIIPLELNKKWLKVKKLFVKGIPY